MNKPSTLKDFLAKVRQYCMQDAEFRHEIEREEYYGVLQDNLQVAYPLHVNNELSVREAFGMTRRISD